RHYSAGDAYCWFVHSARTWLSKVLALRGMTDGLEPRLSPAARVAVEPLAAAFGQLARVWLRKEALSTMALAAFTDLCGRLRISLQNDDAPVLAGCDQCPARCRMLPYIASIDRDQAAAAIAHALPQYRTDAFNHPTSVRSQWHRISTALAQIERLALPPVD